MAGYTVFLSILSGWRNGAHILAYYSRQLKSHVFRKSKMQVSNRWLRMSKSAGLVNNGTRGIADLKSYNVDFVEWGNGPPLILVPGLAGGIALVEPLAIELSHHFR